MAHEIIRIGVYWFPPANLKNLIERTWNREFDEHDNTNLPACRLMARHCGDCPIWGAHATLLDAITILDEDREAFINAMDEVLKEFLPIELSGPSLKKLGHNVFILWNEDEGLQKSRLLRQKILTQAMKFALIEQVNWETINELERAVRAMGMLADPEFVKALDKIKQAVRREKSLKLIYAPNIPLEWYVQNFASGREIEERKLPYAPEPHLSLVTAVRYDEKTGMTPAEVGNRIVANLLNEWKEATGKEALGESSLHRIDSAYIVEPSLHKPMEVTVLDRITGRPRNELRLPWMPKERLPLP